MALAVSRIRSEEALAKVRSLVADAFNEHGSIEVRAGSDEAQQRGGVLQPIFTHALMAGLIPPFSAFLLEICNITGFTSFISIRPRSPFSPPLRISARRFLA